MQNNDGGDSAQQWEELWRTVGESLLGGIHHALNNRVAALSAISQVLGVGLPDAAPLLSSLGGEVQRLEQTVALISHLRRARSRAPEPVQLPELVASLTPLLPHHGDLKEIEFVAASDPGVLPVYAERDLLTRVMLTLLTSVGLSAECAGGGRVRVSYRGDDAQVTARIACEPSDDRRGPPSSYAKRVDGRATAAAVREMNGEIEAVDLPEGRVSYELRLPTLLTARRREGEGRS